jgi:hypothetical protein
MRTIKRTLLVILMILMVAESAVAEPEQQVSWREQYACPLYLALSVYVPTTLEVDQQSTGSPGVVANYQSRND